MANLKEGFTTGLIEAGKAFQNIGAMRMKEEYLAEEKATAAAAGERKSLEFLYSETGKDIRNIRSSLAEGSLGAGGLDPLQAQADLTRLEARQTLYMNAILGIKMDPKDKETFEQIASGEIEGPEASEKSELFKNLTGFAGYLLKKAKKKGIEVAKKFLQDSHPDIWSDTKNNLERFRGREGAVKDEEIIGDVMSLLVETQGMDTARRFFEGMVSGWSLDSTYWPTLEFPEREGQYGSSLLDDATLKEDYKSEEEYRKEAIESRPERRFEYGEETKELLTPGKIDATQQGLIEQGAPISAEEQAYEDARNEAALAGAGSASTDEITPEQMEAMSRETDRQAAIQQQDIVGSPAALESLSSIGGPIGEPAGTTDILTRSNIPEESPEIESVKSRIISSLTQLILSAESNVNGYNAVAGITEGDPNLTNMTIGEIVEKYGNTAVGAGQFKYEEFTVPIAKKYLNMGEPELRAQVFTRQLQNDLIALGLEDAGLALIAKKEISSEEFQKRVANIWRGLPSTKQTQEGESTDTYGNKARVSGGLLSQAIGG